jgi:hypothetical protein
MSVGLVATVKEPRNIVRDSVITRAKPPRAVCCWSAEKFAFDQIHGLARRIFSPGNNPEVRQVVFSAIGMNIDVDEICQCVARALAESKGADIALLTSKDWSGNFPRGIPLRRISSQIGRNLWSLPGPFAAVSSGCFDSAESYLAALRAEFEYSIMAGPPAGQSELADTSARIADGMVLVLSTQSSRRAAALQVKDNLHEMGVRILGAVLIDREFPIPERLYRRL